jgi:Uncharacterized conserved protein
MGIFDKLGKALGTTNDLNIEDYMNSAEMENVDVMNEPADFYIKPLTLQQESDIQTIENELQKKNIILLNVSELAKRPNTLKGLVDTIREYINKINGDIAKIDEDKIILSPAKSR